MKSKIIKFRVSNTESYIIKKKAENCGITTSEFIRAVCFDYTIKPRLKDDEIEAYKMLIKYADNFRRISNLFKLGDTTGVKELSIETSKLIRKHLEKFK
ncbi:plasmid mobilization protein [Chishuiella changwenlii]|uniref:plasmid mobilization protein n=1 Tax=Chishuiella changwenlii TaxID=1434701 RepID=UPI002FDA5934